MSDVPVKVVQVAFQAFQLSHPNQEMDLDRLSEQTGVDWQDPSKYARVPWSVFVDVLNQLQEILGGAEALREFGHTLHEVGAEHHPYGGLVKRFATPHSLFYLSSMWFRRQTYPFLKVVFETLPGGRIQISEQLPPGYVPCEAFWIVSQGSFEGLPTLLGKPKARVEAQIKPDRATFIIDPGPQRGLGRRVMEAARTVLTASTSIETLSLLTDELAQRSIELARAHEQLQKESEERKKAEVLRVQAEEELRTLHSMQELAQLTSEVSRDFNNVLTVIMGNATLLLGRCTDHPDAAETIQAILNATERGVSLVKQLAALGRKQSRDPAEIELNRVIKDATHLIQPLLRSGVALQIELGKDAGRITVQRERLEHLLVDLALDLRERVESGGCLVIKTRDVENDFAEITVANTLAPGTLLSRTEFTPASSGFTGRSLAQNQAFVAESGGTAHMLDFEGNGACYVVTLPRVDRGVPSSKKRKARPSVRGVETVLLVEDDPSVQVFAAQTLERCGFRVLVASSGKEATALSRRYKDSIDILVSDIVMPGMSGPEAAKQITEQRPGLKTLFISGYAGDALDRAAESMHEAKVLPKPFAAEEFARAVRRALDH
ncbi:MAG: hypothetical protein AUK47_23680 [Deltaproteobacteria bacterium CG2_30_63_29]|nr:MAG: hypothetical protein AUK47_23680 [Deltaproteobacteria bacterium CG2_30_63_29]PJB38258.1 MAG: hypothetical protein CO108_19390 [Deltaproteobacteria bacterium CG_4_9_14_3_um_filter_63_12]